MRAELEALSGNGIEFAGRPGQRELRRLYARARALLFPGVTADTDKRDFGRIGPLT